jgi:hypothetical protein
MAALPLRGNFTYSGEDAQASARRAFDRLLRRADLLAAYEPLVADFSAALELIADLDPEDAEAALASRMSTYLDVLADALGAALPAAEGRPAA